MPKLQDDSPLIPVPFEEFAKQYPYRYGTVRVRLTDKLVILTTDVKKHDYTFSINRVNTHLKLICWIDHLLTKPWFDDMQCREFIEKVCERFGWKYHDADCE
jgi:hypothetical protein